MIITTNTEQQFLSYDPPPLDDGERNSNARMMHGLKQIKRQIGVRLAKLDLAEI